jgi:hypothetical protein
VSAFQSKVGIKYQWRVGIRGSGRKTGISGLFHCRGSRRSKIGLLFGLLEAPLQQLHSEVEWVKVLHQSQCLELDAGGDNARRTELAGVAILRAQLI